MIFIEHILAADEIVGSVTSPLTGSYATVFGGFGTLVSSVLRLVFVAAGIYSLFNFVIAGFQYINAGGDGKAMSAAWDRIWHSLLGLCIIVGSFALTAIIGQLLFGNANFILNPTIVGPLQ